MVRFRKIVKKKMYAEKIKKPQGELEELLENERFIHYVGMTTPFVPGIRECLNAVQYTHFRPENQRSVLFFTHTFRYAGKAFIIMSVPIEDKDAVEKIVKECSLEITKGVPAICTKKGWIMLLLDNGRMFFLDNALDHPIYRDDPLIEQALRKAERKTIDKITRS